MKSYAQLFAAPMAINRKKPKEITETSLESLPREHDLVYGLHEVRKRYDQFAFFKGADASPKYIDDYNILSDDTKAGKPHRDLLKDLNEFIQSHPNPGYRIQGKKGSNENIRRKCKAGLDWATQEDSPMTVHFILDDISMDAIIDKNSKGKNGDKLATATASKNRAITGSELRWLYRNWDKDAVQSHVRFWRQNPNTDKVELVSPPWKEDLTLQCFDFKKAAADGTITYQSEDWKRYVPRDKKKPS